MLSPLFEQCPFNASLFKMISASDGKSSYKYHTLIIILSKTTLYTLMMELSSIDRSFGKSIVQYEINILTEYV